MTSNCWKCGCANESLPCWKCGNRDEVLPEVEPAPIDMVLPCPRCGTLHVDAPEPEKNWTNPPHKSHLCHTCGLIWRPADVPTNGVAIVKTRGKADSIADDDEPVTAEWARSTGALHTDAYAAYWSWNVRPDIELVWIESNRKRLRLAVRGNGWHVIDLVDNPNRAHVRRLLAVLSMAKGFTE